MVKQEKLKDLAYKLRRNNPHSVSHELAGNSLEDAAAEIERLREGLSLIESEPINAEYMARNILDGLPAYHGTMLDCTEDCKCKVAVSPAPTFDEWWSSKPSECLIGQDTARWIWQMVHNAELTGASGAFAAKRPA